MDDLFYNLAGLMNQIGLSGAADTLVRLIAAVPQPFGDQPSGIGPAQLPATTHAQLPATTHAQPLAAGDDYTVELASLVEMVTVECSVR